MSIPRPDRAAIRNIERAELRKEREAQRGERPSRVPDRPAIEPGSFGVARVLKSMADGTSFVEAGHPNRVSVPKEEQASPLRPDAEVLVKVLEREDGTLYASSRLNRHLEPAPEDLDGFVDIILWARQGQFWKAIVDERYLGMIPDPGPAASIGDRRTLQVDRVSDGKVYLRLPDGVQPASPEEDRPPRPRVFGKQDGDRRFNMGYAILDKIREEGGFMPVGDHTSPQRIQEIFGVSKAEFKRLVGNLARGGRLAIEDNGLRVTDRPRDDARPPRREFGGGDRGLRPGFGDRRPPFRGPRRDDDRPDGFRGADRPGGRPPYQGRRDDGPREGGDRPRFDRGPGRGREFGDRPPFNGPRDGGRPPFRGGGPRDGDGGRPPFGGNRDGGGPRGGFGRPGGFRGDDRGPRPPFRGRPGGYRNDDGGSRPPRRRDD